MTIHETAFVHPKAHVEDATIGARSKVWQFASVIRGAVIGEDCVVASGACFDGSRCGDRVHLGHNLAAGPGFWIEDDVFIGPNVTLCNDAWPRTDKTGFNLDRGNISVIVHEGASIGANSVILPGVFIGKGAMVACGERVHHDVPAGWLWRKGGLQEVIADESERLRTRMRASGMRASGTLP